MASTTRCPVCHGDVASAGTLLSKCRSCGLVFSRQMALPGGSSIEFFSRAYRGDVPGDMKHFNMRLQMRDYVESLGNLFPFPPHYSTFIKVLRKELPAGSRVLDIGCGSGFFIKRLARSGFQPVGLDVAAGVVELLNGEGYQVWLGNVDTYPRDWPEPRACTLNLVLHHLPDPVGFLTSIRERFPTALLLVSDIRSSSPLYPGWHPPRHLTAWSRPSLEEALQRAGYRTEQMFEFPTQLRAHGDSVGHRLFLGLPRELQTVALLRLYYITKAVALLPLWLALKLLDMDGNVCAVARPNGEGT